MNSQTLKDMQYFVGRVCTIVTKPINRNLDEQRLREMFAIRIGKITVDGVWGTHPYNDELVSYFPFEHIVTIAEETELDPNNPEHRRMIEEYEKKTGKKLKGDIESSEKPPAPSQKSMELPVLDEKPLPEPTGSGDATFVDIESLEQLADSTKRSFEQMNNVNP